jgi:hypothetical protein
MMLRTALRRQAPGFSGEATGNVLKSLARYAGAFQEACSSRGLATEREVFVPVYFNGVVVATYRLDLVVEQRLIVELKSCKTLVAAPITQVFHYLRVTDSSWYSCSTSDRHLM